MALTIESIQKAQVIRERLKDPGCLEVGEQHCLEEELSDYLHLHSDDLLAIAMVFVMANMGLPSTTDKEKS